MARPINPYNGTFRRRQAARRALMHRTGFAGKEGMNSGSLMMKAIFGLGALAVLGGIIAGAASMVVYNSYANELVAPDELAINQPSYGARILDRNGKLLYEYVDDKSGLRRPVKIEEVAPSYLAATIATEDDSFFTNPGVNIPGLMRAAWENTPFSGGGTFEGSGGSSITQQLVKNVYIPEEERQKRDPRRKIKETVYAIELTNRYSKEQILEWYVNQISYGGVYNGVEAAAQGYFNKPAKDLTLAEAALLAGIPQSPAEYDPVNHPDAATARRNDVLDIIQRKGSVQIGEDKFFEVSPADIEAAKQEPINISQKRFPIEAPHWVLQYIEPQLEEMFPEPGALYTDGLVVTTTLDLDMQNQTQQIMEGWISEFENVSASHNGSMMVMDPKTGEILVMVGSRDYFNEAIQGKNNNATACNSPGSSFKPFAYLTTFLNLGWGPGTMILDTPVTYSDGVNGNFTPTNPNHTFVGPVSIRNALGSSLNIPANKAAAAVGPNKIVQLARSIGFKDTFNKCHGAASGYGPAIATGGIDTTLEDMMVGYSVLANEGILRGVTTEDPDRAATLRQIDPISILKVTDNQGVVRYDAEKNRKEQRVAPAAETYEIKSILSDSSAQCLVFGCGGITIRGGQAGVKTGTSEPFTADSANAGKIGETWAFAYTPDLVVGIWAGNSDNAPVVNILSTSISFRSVRDVMQMAYQFPYIQSTTFARPADVVDATICLPSGLKPTDLCGKTSTDLFAKGSVPTQEDTWWQKVKIDARKQLLATAATPPQFVQEKVMLVPPKEAVDSDEEKKAMEEWAKSLGVELAPTQESDGLPAGGGDLSVFIISPSANQSIPLNTSVGILGRATNPDFKSYTLEFGQGTSPNAFTRISENTNAVVQGQLGQWTTAGLTPGAYTLRLVVVDKDNNRSSYSVIVYVGQDAPALTTTTTPAADGVTTTPTLAPNPAPAATPTPVAPP
jgi:membrane peptidoglycan carboxypeptidase